MGFSFTGDSQETLVIPPSYDIDEVSAPYWQVHMMDAPGFKPPNDLLKTQLPLLTVWTTLLQLQPQVCFVVTQLHYSTGLL